MSKFVLANMKLTQRGRKGQGPQGWVYFVFERVLKSFPRLT
jgi:hypothetical protein